MTKFLLALCLLLSLLFEPSVAAPPATSASNVSLTKSEKDFPSREASRLLDSGKYRRALLVLQANIDDLASPKPTYKISIAPWYTDPTGQNLALRELNAEQLRRLHLSDIYGVKGMVSGCLNQKADAVDCFSKAVAFNPYNGAAFSNLCQAYFRVGRLDDALAAAGKALQISDRFEFAYRDRAAVYRARNQFDLERKDLESYNRCRSLNAKDNLNFASLIGSKYMYSLISRQAPSARKLIALGVVNRQLHHLGESEKCHLAAIKLDGKLVEAHWSYGLLLMEQRKYSDAVREFSQAIALDSTCAMPYFDRAKAYSALKKYSDAMADYSKIIEINPKGKGMLLNTHVKRAGCYGHLKEYAAAIRDLSKALTFVLLPEERAEILSNRGALYERLGNKNQALKDYEAAMVLAPDNKLISERRGKIMLSLGEFEQATVDLSNSSKTEVGAVSKAPPSAADLKGQIAHYDKLIKMFPGTATDSLYNRGLLYLTMGDAAKAAADMQAVVAQSKDCNATANSAVCYGSIALRLQNKTVEADKLLVAYGKRLPSKVLPKELEYFLNRARQSGSLSRAPSLDRIVAGDDKYKTRVNTLLGLDAYSRNDKNSARKYLSLVRNTGEPSMDEFALAVSYLKHLGQN
ncbi:MAG: tetratricopeptide repeat protein [Candidatus Obscuribacterales bacterium]